MGRGPALARVSQAGRRPVHRRHPPHRAAVLLPRPSPRRDDPICARDAGRDRRQGGGELRARRDDHRRRTRRAARRQHRPARGVLDFDELFGRGLARDARRARAGEDARDQPQGVRGRPRLGGELRAPIRRRASSRRRPASRPRAAPRRRGGRDRRSLVQGVRHLRHAVPGAVSGDDGATGRDGRCGRRRAAVAGVCEWLCPDFAVSVRAAAREAQVA